MPTTAPASVARLFEEQLLYYTHVPDQWPGLGEMLRWCTDMRPGTAAVLMAAGFVYLLYGHGVFRALVTINCTLLGAWIGALIGKSTGGLLPGALIGGFLSAVIAWPTMKYAVALMAGMVGFVLGASVWQSTGLDPRFAPAGGAIGLTFLAMLSFINFRTTIIVATGLQGATMVLLGTLGLLYKYQDLVPRLDSTLLQNTFIVPAAILVPAVLGFVYQHSTPVAVKK